MFYNVWTTYSIFVDKYGTREFSFIASYNSQQFYALIGIISVLNLNYLIYIEHTVRSYHTTPIF